MREEVKKGAAYIEGYIHLVKNILTMTSRYYY